MTDHKQGADTPLPPSSGTQPMGRIIQIADLNAFVRESNRIEGIHRDRTDAEFDAHEAILALSRISIPALEQFVAVVAPEAELRDRVGMDVRVGRYIPPRGGAEIRRRLAELIDQVNNGALTAFEAHVAYEKLHPFMDGNGRSGRVLWLWMMHGLAPLGFLHTFYYQTLNAARI